MRACISWDHFDTAHGWQVSTAAGEADTRIITLLGPQQPAPAAFTQAIPSWRAATPLGSWIEVQLRVRVAGRWSGFYKIAQWDSAPDHSVRRSFGSQRDEYGRVATDTLVLASPADTIQARVLLHGRGAELQALWLAWSGPSQHASTPASFTARELTIPPRAQTSYPNGGVICSPTAVAMLLAYWYAQTNDPALAPFAERAAVSEIVAPGVYDPVYEGYGNWGFNTAFAASYGLDAYVARLSSLQQLEPWVAAGVPVIISAAWDAGELANAPIPASDGHLLIVAGFDARGDVIVADPRGDSEAEVRRVYAAAQLEAAWQNNSAGTVYLIHPRSWPAPALTR